MTIVQLLAALNGQVAIVERHGALDRSVTSVTDDSRAVVTGSLFVAVLDRFENARHIAHSTSESRFSLRNNEIAGANQIVIISVVCGLSFVGWRAYCQKLSAQLRTGRL